MSRPLPSEGSALSPFSRETSMTPTMRSVIEAIRYSADSSGLFRRPFRTDDGIAHELSRAAAELRAGPRDAPSAEGVR
jgi:hypothetical protein